mmetsp:Transcript_44444/g.87838  ORF Transcript_44444/g.87838 Transcript_44444/m.87838 type:complete len:127 (+) Transcript_44444:108-488(+)
MSRDTLFLVISQSVLMAVNGTAEPPVSAGEASQRASQEMHRQVREPAFERCTRTSNSNAKNFTATCFRRRGCVIPADLRLAEGTERAPLEPGRQATGTEQVVIPAPCSDTVKVDPSTDGTEVVGVY